jgi:hypothetical protein
VRMEAGIITTPLPGARHAFLLQRMHKGPTQAHLLLWHPGSRPHHRL